MSGTAPTVVPVALPGHLRAGLVSAGKKVRASTEFRDLLICQAAAEGASLREIAEAVGLHHTGVRKIVMKGRA